MENLNEKTEAFDKATQTIQKRPWAAIIVILVVYSYFLYKVGSWSSERQITSLEKEKDELKEEIANWKTAYQSLTNNLLIKNNIIYEQREVIKYADSTLSKVQPLIKDNDNK